LDAHLQWLDDCARAQVVDYETWLEGRVAQLEAENAALKRDIDLYHKEARIVQKINNEIREENVTLATVSDDKSLIIKQRGREITRLRFLNASLRRENAALSELLSPLVDVELERDIAMSENQRLTKHVEDYEEENAALRRGIREIIATHYPVMYDEDKLGIALVALLTAEEQDDAISRSQNTQR